MNYEISQINDSSIQSLAPLAVDAEGEGFKFVKKTIDEWISGANRFSGPGEILWGVFDGGKCVALGGLNVDPHANDPKVGRVRRLYVSSAYRKKGVATALLEMIIGKARQNFTTLRLSAHRPGASNEAASKLYEEIGFAKDEGPNQTHVKSLLQ